MITSEQAHIECLVKERDELKQLLLDAKVCGNVMSNALGNHECAVPWDDDIVPRILRIISHDV